MERDLHPAASVCGEMTELQSIRVPTVDSASILASVVCGVDGSEEAARFELVGVIHAGLVESVASVMPALTVEPERLLRKQRGRRSRTPRATCAGRST